MNVTLAPIESSLSGAEITTIIIASVAALPLLIILIWGCVKCCSQKRDKEVLMDYTEESESMEQRISIQGRHGLIQNKLK